LTSDRLTDFQDHRKPHPNRLKETSKLQVLTIICPTDASYGGARVGLETQIAREGKYK